MSNISKRVDQLEDVAGCAQYQPPTIIHWIEKPGDVGNWATAWIREANGHETIRRRADETLEDFKRRVNEIAELAASGNREREQSA